MQDEIATAVPCTAARGVETCVSVFARGRLAAGEPIGNQRDRRAAPDVRIPHIRNRRIEFRVDRAVTKRNTRAGFELEASKTHGNQLDRAPPRGRRDGNDICDM
jgi:hypothetical protein